MNDSPVHLVERWRQGDQAAAQALFELYVARLVAVVGDRLSSRFVRHVDPDDVVQSAFRSFFCGAREGRFDFERDGDLWRLLATMTLHKLRDQVRRHVSEKRDVHAEHNFSGEDSLLGLQPKALAGAPSPVEAVALVDQLEQVMRLLEPEERRMLELRLQGYNLEEIAAEVRLSRRSVRRVLDRVRQHLEQRMPPP